jgi:uncharacterized membrane protein YqjE
LVEDDADEGARRHLFCLPAILESIRPHGARDRSAKPPHTTGATAYSARNNCGRSVRDRGEYSHLEVTPSMIGEVSNGRSLAAILTEMRNELQEFVQTRIELLRRELDEKVKTLKAALPLALVGITFLLTAFLLLSLALVAILAVAFEGNPFNWFFGFLIVGFVWLVIGGIAALSAKRALTEKGVIPRKTIQVLSGDKAWLQREAKNVL